MATSPTPPPSMMADDRQMRGNSPPQQISKRDKKRSQLVEKIDDIVKAFSKNKDTEYRNQLQAIQVDINIILSTEPHDVRKVMNGHADEILTLLMGYNGGDPEQMKQQIENFNLAELTGKIFQDFMRDVEKAEEIRDTHLTMLKTEFEKQQADLENSNLYLQTLAEGEHRALKSSLRDRLINNLQARKNKLSREKENAEINEGNSLLMHPSQYSINNPSSPGGLHGKRATRHRREMEDMLPGYSDNKRKRKPVEDAGSPAPSRRLIDNNGHNQIWVPGEIMKSTDDGITPMYSIDKLFTDRELQMSYNHAAVAAHEVIVRHKLNVPEGQGNDADDAEEDNDESIATPAVLAAVGMERQVSHATRSTRGVNGSLTASGIEVLTDMASNVNRIASQLPKVPPPGTLHSNAYKPWLFKGENRNEPQTLAYEEYTRDLTRMEKAIIMNGLDGQGLIGSNLDDEVLNDRELLRAATADPGTTIAPVAFIKKSKALAAVIGGESMGRVASNDSRRRG